jgi:REP element-mobilizing transposase RayT
MGKGIYNRGYLPHWDFERAVQAITFRLADSVPSSVVAGWQVELASILDEPTRKRKLHRRISRYEDAGHGEAVLGRAECAEAVQSKLIEGHSSGYKLLDWCIMPNHVHVLCKLEGDSILWDILKQWKGSSAIEINRLLGRTGTLWQREYHDRLVRDMDHFHDCRIYIRNNPVKAGLCKSPEEWRYSSAGCSWEA